MEDKIVSEFLEKKKNEPKNLADAAIEQVTQRMMQNERNAGKDFRESSKDVAHIAVTAEAMDKNDLKNKKFLDRVKSIKQDEIRQSFESEKFFEEAKKIEAKKKKAEAFYYSFRPILEFDFSHLIIKKEKTILFKKKNPDKEQQEPEQPKEEKPKTITYQDRSYGISLMFLMLCLLIVPYCIVTILLAIFNSINAIFDGIARFGKPALIICGTTIVIALMLIGAYCTCFGIDKLFGTNILSVLK